MSRVITSLLYLLLSWNLAVAADSENMTDREIVMLWDSVQQDADAFASLLPKSAFTLELLFSPKYRITDLRAPELQIEGYRPTTRYSAEVCWNSETKSESGVCLRIFIPESAINVKKLRKLATVEPPPKFLVKFLNVTGLKIDGKDYVVISFNAV